MSLLSFAKKLTARTDASKHKARAKTVKARKNATVSPERTQAEPAADVIAPPVVLTSELIPIVTEKSLRLQEHNTVAFRVPHTVTKQEIAAAITSRFGVSPLRIRMIRSRGKERRRGNTYGQTAQWKKVYVTVEDVTKLASNP